MKKVFFASFFRNISKTAKTFFDKKNEQNHGVFVYKKALVSEYRKNYINCFVKMSVSTSPNFVYALAPKLV